MPRFLEPRRGFLEPRRGFLEPRRGFLEPRRGFLELKCWVPSNPARLGSMEPSAWVQPNTLGFRSQSLEFCVASDCLNFKI
ncbi:hypothetical protein SLEP1_g40846 [Rubroshorea leprosula]|uniref:Uncharacterized protein n=1 Tax=Rubroshorea leprosula TaxID=152421 RepID=A0AAV5L5K3_9ROSI|nr:hypothetical protein SLEP1_g40846 [Rubroshorea leprosula]